MEVIYGRRCVELSVGGRELRDMDFLSKSDPFVVLYLKESDAAVATFEEDTREILASTGSLSRGSGPPPGLFAQGRADVNAPPGWVLIGKTETIWDNLNPNFVTCFYFPQDTPDSRDIRLRAVYYDQDDENADLRRHDLIGSCEFSLSEVTESGSHQVELSNRKGRVDGKCGFAHFVADEANFDKGKQKTLNLELVFSPDSEIPRGSRGPKAMFFIVSRSARRPKEAPNQGITDWVPVYRSGHTTPPVNPGQEFKFQELSISSERLYANDESRKFKVELFIHNKKGNHLLAGWVCMSLSELRRESHNKTFPMTVGVEEAELQTGSIRVNTSFSPVPGAPNVLMLRCTKMAWRGKVTSGTLLQRIGIL